MVVILYKKILSLCRQTAFESVNGLDTLDGDRERVPEARGSMHKVTLAKPFQATARCRHVMFTLGSVSNQM